LRRPETHRAAFSFFYFLGGGFPPPLVKFLNFQFLLISLVADKSARYILGSGSRIFFTA
jgi:hypothetical protein